jgi:hypothetical protein
MLRRLSAGPPRQVEAEADAHAPTPAPSRTARRYRLTDRLVSPGPIDKLNIASAVPLAARSLRWRLRYLG